MVYYDRIDVSEGTDVNKIRQTNQKSVIFFTIGIFQIKGLRFNQMSAKRVTMY